MNGSVSKAALPLMLKGGAGSAKRNPGTAGQGTRDGRRQGVGNASSTALLCATQVR